MNRCGFTDLTMKRTWDIDAEIVGASNVRMLGMKRENLEGVPLLVITNGTNIAAFGLGAARVSWAARAIFEVLGSSTNVLMGNMCIQELYGTPDLTQNTYTKPLPGSRPKVLWPNHVSLYKRGKIDDTGMFGGGIRRRFPASLLPRPGSSSQINLAWNNVAGATGYKLQRKTGAAAPTARLPPWAPRRRPTTTRA